MKKTLLIITLLFSLFTFSQNSKIKFGFQAGLNYSNFRGYNIPSTFNQVYSESPAFAYLGGINVEYKIKERLSLKFELNYERKSQKADNNIEIRENFDDQSLTPQTQNQIDLTHLANGYYIARINNESRSTQQKLIKN